jgi:tetratricopeptide (TPR) repeat protein
MNSRSFVRLAFRVVVFVCLATLAPRLAHADAASDRKARAHAKTAKAYFDAGDFAHAIVEYQAAYDLDHKPSRLYNLAVCHERSGDAKGALALYRQYLEADPDGEAARPAAESIAALDRELAASDAAAAAEAEAAKQRAAEEERTRQEEEAKLHPRPPAEPKDIVPAPTTPAPQIVPEITTWRAPPPNTRDVKQSNRTWLLAAAAGAAIVTGAIIDNAPSSASNGELDGTDFIPLGFYALGATLAFAFVF